MHSLPAAANAATFDLPREPGIAKIWQRLFAATGALFACAAALMRSSLRVRDGESMAHLNERMLNDIGAPHWHTLIDRDLR